MTKSTIGSKEIPCDFSAPPPRSVVLIWKTQRLDSPLIRTIPPVSITDGKHLSAPNSHFLEVVLIYALKEVEPQRARIAVICMLFYYFTSFPLFLSCCLNDLLFCNLHRLHTGYGAYEGICSALIFDDNEMHMHPLLSVCFAMIKTVPFFCNGVGQEYQ